MQKNPYFIVTLAILSMLSNESLELLIRHPHSRDVTNSRSRSSSHCAGAAFCPAPSLKVKHLYIVHKEQGCGQSVVVQHNQSVTGCQLMSTRPALTSALVKFFRVVCGWWTLISTVILALSESLNVLR